MSFTTLEQRFNQVSKQIYNRFSPSSDQLVKIKPDTNGVLGSNSRVKNDTRLLPLVSTRRDLTRISLFLRSNDGVLFLGKQTLLQTGNTFAETRLYNPLEVLINTDTFIGRRTARHIGFPVGVSSLKRPTREKRGALQTETVNKFSSPLSNANLLSRVISQVGGVASSLLNASRAFPKLTTYFGDKAKEFYVRPEDKAFLNGKNINPSLYIVQSLEQRGRPNTAKTPDANASLGKIYEKYTVSKNPEVQRSFKDLEKTLNTNGYFGGRTDLNLDGPFNEARNVSGTSVTKDPLNVMSIIQSPSSASLYRNILGEPNNRQSIATFDNDTQKSDIIKFIFQTAGVEPVHFRAFISSLKQNVKPEFNEQKYIGRTERFVTYGGVRRVASMEFDIAAFSREELNQAWARVNYLTGLAFPVSPSESGFMVPPLFKLTVGGIYDNQPCYLDTLDFTFIDDSTTFDIDSEVTQVIRVSMSIILLEKRSKFYDSPFYKIMEDLQQTQTA